MRIKAQTDLINKALSDVLDAVNLLIAWSRSELDSASLLLAQRNLGVASSNIEKLLKQVPPWE